MNIGDYLEQVRAQYSSGHATEHSYRPALHALFESIDPALTVVNEPKKSEAGMPDFLFQRGDIPLGWAEAKNIDKDVIKLKGYSIEQRKRYEKAYPNLIYTNGVDFEFIRAGESVHFVSIADFLIDLQPRPDRFAELERQLRLFAQAKPISIRSAVKLAEMMAAKAAIIKDEIGIALDDDKEFRSSLGGQYKSFKANLLPNLAPDEFADIYAETITYGMFAARFHDDDLSTFSRQEALEKLPASNPFLKGLFRYIAGTELPRRLEYIVDDLVQVMRASDPHSLFRDFGKFTARNDPFVHFYEDFLAAYNPKKRKSRGVWYTPEPVVDFIVRAVDEVLKCEFGLTDGLADTSKVAVDWDTGTNHPKSGKPITEKRDVHKVQILDPATGTGTFLAKAVQLIADRVKARAPGKWSNYVEEDLLPRVHGFELLMASYAMCHMKLDMMLGETGYKPSAKPPRLSVWLTNSLEPPERDVKDLFFQPLAEEARGASEVKRQAPIMCVIGNPPYSGESANKGAHIMALMEAYKKEPGGKERLKERTSKWINDDYVKFVRMAEELIAKNPSGGVLGFITNHGYLDNPTFRGMRWHLLKTFDKIWVLNLQGNSKSKKTPPDGLKDKNVFDIQQGVAIIVALWKGGERRNLATLAYGEVWGSRDKKNDWLLRSSLSDPSFSDVQYRESEFAMVPRDTTNQKYYELAIPTTRLFREHVAGVITTGDEFVIRPDRQSLIRNIQYVVEQLPSAQEFASRFSVGKNYARWVTENRKASKINDSEFKQIDYRPFDVRYIYYNSEFVWRRRYETLRNVAEFDNIALIVPRQCADDWQHVLVTNRISGFNLTGSAGRYGSGFVFPLYLYPRERGGQRDVFSGNDRTLNFDANLYAAICKAAGLDPANQAAPNANFRAATGEARPSEVKVFDYIYGVLHSPAYRKTFAEFLKIDFPHIPYPPSPEAFRQVSEKGEALRRLHLMEAAAIGDTPFPYHGDSDDVVAPGYPKWEAAPSHLAKGGELLGGEQGKGPGHVHINAEQYFANVPEIAWSFHIGGYQPAQRWLKDRRGSSLSFDDITHYQRIVKVLADTDRIMMEIELPLS